MGSALINGICEASSFPPCNIYVSDQNRQQIEKIDDSSVHPVDTNIELVSLSDIIVLAVKPAQAFDVLREIAPYVNESKTVISIAAGLSLAKITELLPKANIRVVRAMPNINATVNAGLTAFCANSAAVGDRAVVKQIFNSVGTCIELPEAQFHTFTAIAGSGPGFIFYFAELLKKICEEKGLKGVADKIVRHLFFGSGKLLLSTESEPKDLKKMVSSPGGTTVAGLEVLRQEGYERLLRDVINASEKRSREIGEVHNE